ncbi:LysR substrate-binding domain-containing protein [Nocardia sp. CA-290969]|uniref:LysR substrate-binding domain-containing protein n=1 Tax=Nocardia sp. CA-290969 TaxID=3239986 RepID=UPI003D8D498A
MPRLVEDLEVLHPALSIDLVEAEPAALRSQLLDGHLDDCFIHKAHAGRAVTTHPVLPIRLSVVVRESHPLAQRASVSPWTSALMRPIKRC